MKFEFGPVSGEIDVGWRWPEWWRWCGMVGAAGAFWINEGVVARIICACLFMAFAVRITRAR